MKEREILLKLKKMLEEAFPHRKFVVDVDNTLRELKVLSDPFLGAEEHEDGMHILIYDSGDGLDAVERLARTNPGIKICRGH